MDFVKFLRTPFYMEHLWTTASGSAYFKTFARDLKTFLCFMTKKNFLRGPYIRYVGGRGWGTEGFCGDHEIF